MHEVFPIVAAMLMALIVYRLVALRLRTGALVASSIVIGALASFVSGELFVSWAYLAFDIVQALIVAGATIALTTLWSYRPERLR